MRVILIVLDSVGIGAAPDAAQFGDSGADTLGHIDRGLADFKLPNFSQLGLGNIVPLKSCPEVDRPAAHYGKLIPQAPGKDTTTGHWELAGLILEKPFPTYPDGFPDEIIEPFKKEIGTEILYNKPASGTEIINRLGKKHMETGFPIVYTSADSVFQIACHEDVVPLERLYEMCRIARRLLVGRHAVARVIARPFVGRPGSFVRTENRRDFSLAPPGPTLLSEVSKKGYPVIAVGKIEDIFQGRGITEAYHTRDNRDGIEKIKEIAAQGGEGLVMANLVDFDMKYGHRRDVHGYARALREFDESIPAVLNLLQEDDLLVITADHGCDPTYRGTDHTREMVPVLIVDHKRQGRPIGTRNTFADLGKTIAELFGVGSNLAGSSFADLIFQGGST